MGWANSIARACTLIVLLVAVFALTACGTGGQDPAAPAPAPGHVDPSVEEFLDDTLPDGTSGTVVAARDGLIVHCRGLRPRRSRGEVRRKMRHSGTPCR